MGDLLDECLRDCDVRAGSTLPARAAVHRALSEPATCLEIRQAVLRSAGGRARARALLVSFIRQVIEYFIWHEDLRSSGFAVLPSLVHVRAHSVRDALASLCEGLGAPEAPPDEPGSGMQGSARPI